MRFWERDSAVLERGRSEDAGVLLTVPGHFSSHSCEKCICCFVEVRYPVGLVEGCVMLSELRLVRGGKQVLVRKKLQNGKER